MNTSANPTWGGSQAVAGVGQGRLRAAVSDAFVSMGSAFASACTRDVFPSCSDTCEETI